MRRREGGDRRGGGGGGRGREHEGGRATEMKRLTFSPSGLVLQPPLVQLPGDCSRALHPSPGFVLLKESGTDDETKE